jgi:RNA recognition motif-containing protein
VTTGSYGTSSSYPSGSRDGRTPNKAPPRRDEAPPSKSIWVGGIPPDCSEEELQNTFGRYGYMDSVRVGCVVLFLDVLFLCLSYYRILPVLHFYVDEDLKLNFSGRLFHKRIVHSSDSGIWRARKPHMMKCTDISCAPSR